MPRLAANLSMLFTEAPLLDRFGLAAQAGFMGVEMQFPYGEPAAAIAARLHDTGLEMVMFNLPAGNFAKGERGIACLPGREQEFREGVEQALDYARTLGVRQMNCLAGIAPPNGHRAVRETLVANLGFAAKRLADEGMVLLVEALNTHELPGFYISRTRQALDVIADVGLTNIKLQYDFYHMHLMEGDLAGTLTRQLPRIGHIQIANPPNRHEPGEGELNIDFLLEHLDQLGYAGWVGCEYRPSKGTAASLGWAKRWLAR
ncbi:MAG: hydroxypyruvate isomerase [Rhodospirillaceae bacterium]|nr:hydroxypyruvate isomerase [Rhodospirillales bacterium]